MKWRYLLTPIFASTLCFSSSAHAKETAPGIVNFTTCVTDSKYGQQEQENFDSVRNQITSIINDIENQRQDIENKLQNPEFVDSLSPEAEHEMKARFQTLSEELARYQNQYYQVMNQANMKFVQLMSNYVSQAAEAIAKKNSIHVVLNKEACFYYDPKEDITLSVIAEMDKNFAKEAKEQSTTSAKLSENAPN